MDAAEVLKRRELGNYLLARREELQPEEMGVVAIGRRRVRGLRRHEVADAAGVSVTLYTWLEQGREVRVSAAVLDAVSRALRLDEDGWRYVRLLGGSPVGDPKAEPDELNVVLANLVHEQLPSPALLINSTSDIVERNRSFTNLFGELLDPDEPNTLVMYFTDDRMRALMPDWEKHARGRVARFRTEYGQAPDNPRFDELISKLNEASPVFHAEWERREVVQFEDYVLTLHHPVAGELSFNQVHLRPLAHPRLTLIVHPPANHETRAKLVKMLDERTES